MRSLLLRHLGAVRGRKEPERTSNSLAERIRTNRQKITAGNHRSASAFFSVAGAFRADAPAERTGLITIVTPVMFVVSPFLPLFLMTILFVVIIVPEAA